MDETGIGYINAHGTSTPENDKMEYGAMSAVFGEALAGYSGLVEQVDDRSYTDGCRRGRGGVLVADDPHRHAAADDQLPEPGSVDHSRCRAECEAGCAGNAVLSNSFGFGGQNASLVMAAEPA
jgi:3-oxoacyl-[acyl-carrier-protein] synthase II